MAVTAQEIGSLVEKYLIEYPDEASRLARLREALAPAGEPDGHVTSAAVLIDPRWRVLHLYDRDRGRALLPEVHLTDADRSLAGAALRGLERLQIGTDTVSPLAGFESTPLDIEVLRRPADRATGRREHWHFAVRHAFQVAGTPTVRPHPDEPAEPTWLPLDRVPGFTLRLKLRAIHRGVTEDVGSN